jgi:hypothetical protein
MPLATVFLLAFEFDCLLGLFFVQKTKKENQKKKYLVRSRKKKLEGTRRNTVKKNEYIPPWQRQLQGD